MQPTTLELANGESARLANEGRPEPFERALSRRALHLCRDEARTLQVNIGLLCNQTCRHCHLEAGPHRREVMDPGIMGEVVNWAHRSSFSVIDITGGAPELHPHLISFMERLSPLTRRLIFRSNLTALDGPGLEGLLDALVAHRVVVVASLPSPHPGQTDAQRGPGVFARSISTLRRLNGAGYGMDASPLELHLVTNPTGAFLPAPQRQAEARFKAELEKRWGVFFHSLYSFANAPLGRFRAWLVETGNLEPYMQRLAHSFNPEAVKGLMCRTTVSVSWKGFLYDCDFNLGRQLFMGGQKVHVSDLEGPPAPGSPIAVADHCYTCTAGAGFT
jgi:radical SAM/Cys-rich protein